MASVVINSYQTNGAGDGDMSVSFLAGWRESDLGDERRELVGADAPALVEPHLLVGLAVGHRPVAHARGVSRLAALVLEREDQGHERLVGWLPRLDVGIGRDEPLIGHNVEIDAVVG